MKKTLFIALFIVLLAPTATFAKHKSPKKKIHAPKVEWNCYSHMCAGRVSA